MLQNGQIYVLRANKGIFWFRQVYAITAGSNLHTDTVWYDLRILAGQVTRVGN